MHPPPAERNTPEPTDAVLAATLEPVATGGRPPCPVDRWPRRRRNQICISVIAVGMANFLVYTLSYAAIGGDAHNGHRRVAQSASGERVAEYYVRGHFIHSLDGRERTVSRGVWLYSYIHSISVPLTSGAMIFSMLVLARPHILATMRGGWISGETFVVGLATIVLIGSLLLTGLLSWHFAEVLLDHG
ncbi:MAG: hypothetical protein IPM18_04250 [Phycisphaerales bacterium]|nr:hypothetical protein [Phycisphaerales bacterium]